MKCQIWKVDDHGREYESLVFICPGCEVQHKGSGLHMLPVGGDVPEGKPRWDFNNNFESPTLNPSILTRFNMGGEEFVCHSFLRDGVFEFLSDSTHQYAGQKVAIPDLPDWAVNK